MSRKKEEKHGPKGVARNAQAAEILEKHRQNKPSSPPTSKQFPDKGPRRNKRGR